MERGQSRGSSFFRLSRCYAITAFSGKSKVFITTLLHLAPLSPTSRLEYKEKEKELQAKNSPVFSALTAFFVSNFHNFSHFSNICFIVEKQQKTPATISCGGCFLPCLGNETNV